MTLVFREEQIDHRAIDGDAISIVEKLEGAGYVAYLVGGCVRDLLNERKPKDFDISTSAPPEAIKDLFGRSCILIGRRFRLAHLRFGGKVFEVSTFRAFDSSDRLVVRDNRWGSPEEDAFRRDFTINGMFYDPIRRRLIDYVGGFEDLKKGLLRPIGDPKLRFRQDPVRMIRLLKFQARYGFQVEEDVQDVLRSCRREIIKSAPARVLEEMLRMMESGYQVPFLTLLRDHALIELIFPWLPSFLNRRELIEGYPLLGVVDDYHREGRGVLPRSLILAAFLFPMLLFELDHLHRKRNQKLHLGDVDQSLQALLRGIEHSSFPHLPHRLLSEAGQITALQFRLTPPSLFKLHRHHRIHKMGSMQEALSLLELRTRLDHSLKPKLLHWQKFFHERQGQEDDPFEEEGED